MHLSVEFCVVLFCVVIEPVGSILLLSFHQLVGFSFEIVMLTPFRVKANVNSIAMKGFQLMVS